MWFWWFILICDLLVPLLMVVCGILMWKRCPKRINGWLGYRTFRSMMNMDTWTFAHGFCGRLWWRIGWILLISTVLLHLPFYKSEEDTLGVICLFCTVIQLVVLILPVFFTERALKKRFTDHGTRR